MPMDFLTRVQRAFAPLPAADVAGRPVALAVSSLVEQLTSRELEVLDMLAAGRSNQAIAAELVVSLDTVKNTSVISWANSVRPTAPRRSPGPDTWASLRSAQLAGPS
jgi:FixJ family two-component response regulator